jgi:hypothetical protein
MLNVYKNQQNRQTGSRDSDGFKNASHDMGYLYEACDQISDIRFLPSIVAEKNEHICSMCIKINKVGKQEVGI